MNDVILINDQWYVLATSSRADGRSLVMKNEETFGLFDRFGDIQHIGVGEQGLYHRGTRHLSHYEMLINDRRPMLLNSSVSNNNNTLAVDLTTPDLYQDDKLLIPKGTVHIFRARFLCQGVSYEHIRIRNFGPHRTSFGIKFLFTADFADIFEVRGQKRSRRGKIVPAGLGPGELILGYLGLDKVKRQTRIAFEPAPDRLSEDEAAYLFSLQPRGEVEIFLTISCINGQDRPLTLPYSIALAGNKSNWARKQAGAATVRSSNEQFNDWLNRSLADLLMLVTTTGHGQYPYAGVPWFSTPFGRDGIIAAWQTLWINPDLARGVLAFLAQNQADEESPAQDAEPGKILHETRQGEMAALGEVPFRRYYGSVDATPLFVMLAGQYFTRTGDQTFLKSIWPSVKRALNWIDTYGDQDGDGFVEYARKSGQGIIQQGWKDSNDSVFHQDGSPAEGPIALCEVQGYVYGAKLAGAELAAVLGEEPLAASLREAAETLKKRFNQAFWCDEINSFALALDGEKKPCRVRASNAGHALFTGIANEKYAKIMAETLFGNDFFSGWGVRTVAATEKRYNP
ncbi:MAG: amylo-alpha-1,6-glucosidase, partial [Deltaproteobacteria bacterium]|nr:amylo-alpha-1,6-glucosidase [Deltaproteobacteria bacterium]